jgi:hypothetical protein
MPSLSLCGHSKQKVNISTNKHVKNPQTTLTRRLLNFERISNHFQDNRRNCWHLRHT